MFGYLEKRSGNLYVYQTRYFAREKNFLNYYAKPGEKKPRGSINLFQLSAVTLVDSTQDVLAPGPAVANVSSVNLNATFSSPAPPPHEKSLKTKLSRASAILSAPMSPKDAKLKVLEPDNSAREPSWNSTPINSSAGGSPSSPPPASAADALKKEFMLQVGDRNFILRAPDAPTRQAWLEELSVWVKVNHEDESIPIPKPTLRGLLRAIEYCRENGIETEGLFRVPGSKANVDAICLGVYFHGDKYFDPATFPKEFSVLDVGSAIKKLFRELPENIFTNKLLPAFRIATIPSTVEDMMPLLPAENINVLHKLIDLCDALCKNTEVTKMTPKNLAISFGPSLSDSDSLSATGLGVLFEILVNERETVFKKVPDIDLRAQTRFKVAQTTRTQGQAKSSLGGGIRQSVFGGGKRKGSGSTYTSDDNKDDADLSDPDDEALVYEALDSVKAKGGLRAPLEKLWGELKTKDEGFLSSLENLLQVTETVIVEAEENALVEDEEEVQDEKEAPELEREKKRSRLLAARVLELETMVTILNNAAAASAALASTKKK
eukprot:TRINITY_DN4140_c0_g1_i12.p1 TRINITY_DN4140_c0_g1~~TRINITY_DN4140_c0_g1_i12.p1  ORF type:complete len:548 (-),score=157.84 TRINITY_DN4140_c0_g1_i12:2147-3790(-)